MDQMTDNKQKAQRLIDAGAVTYLAGTQWVVRSLSTIGAVYFVKWFGSGGSCTCRKYKYSQPAWCHHLEAVQIITSAETCPPEELPLVGEYLDEQIP